MSISTFPAGSDFPATLFPFMVADEDIVVSRKRRGGAASRPARSSASEGNPFPSPCLRPEEDIERWDGLS
jgi:hypothetical protein